MIQRVQTLYLLLATVFAALALFLPVIGFADANGTEVATATGLGFTSTLNELAGNHPIATLCATWLCTLLPFVTIFFFKKRKRQMRLCSLNVVLNVVALASFAYTAYAVNEAMSLVPALRVGIACPVLAIISTLMAHRAIKRDDDLVRSEYRIR